MDKPAKNTICIWYDHDAEEAARFYAGVFPDSSVGTVHRAAGDYPSGKKGDVLTVWFEDATGRMPANYVRFTPGWSEVCTGAQRGVRIRERRFLQNEPNFEGGKDAQAFGQQLLRSGGQSCGTNPIYPLRVRHRPSPPPRVGNVRKCPVLPAFRGTKPNGNEARQASVLEMRRTKPARWNRREL